MKNMETCTSELFARSYRHSQNRNPAFTLAEVLITLGIIGIVAAMTLPSLISNYKRKENVAMLKKAYSELSQSLSRAEADYGTMDTWSFKGFETSAERIDNFTDYYLKPYVKMLAFCRGADGKSDISMCWAPELKSLNGTKINLLKSGQNAFTTPAGYSVLYWLHGTGTGGHFIVDVNGPKKGPNQYGIDVFRFLLTFKDEETGYTDTVGYQPGLRGYGLNNSATREKLLENCSKTASGSLAGYYCAGLIMFDGWEMKKDYPW